MYFLNAYAITNFAIKAPLVVCQAMIDYHVRTMFEGFSCDY